MTALYHADTNELEELPQMEKPERPPNKLLYGSHDFEYARDMFNYNGNLEIYNDHLASLRRHLPCSPQPGFKDGEIYVEGVDYEVKGAGDWKWCTQLRGNYFAFPFVPVKSEERTGIFSVQRLTNGSGHSNLTIITEEAIPDVYIGSLLLVPFVHGYKDPEKVKVLLDENGKPVATKLRTCIVVEYFFS